MDFEMFSADSKSNYRQCGKLISQGTKIRHSDSSE